MGFENIQQIYKRTAMYIFRTPFPKNASKGLLLDEDILRSSLT